MDWTIYLEVSLIILAFGLIYVFLSSFLKPLGKHLAQRLISASSASKAEPKVEAAVSAARPVSQESEAEFVRKLVQIVVDAMTPGLVRFLESTFWTAYGLGAFLGGIIVIILVLLDTLLGLDPLYAGLSAAGLIVLVGAIEMWIGSRKSPLRPSN